MTYFNNMGPWAESDLGSHDNKINTAMFKENV